MGSLALAWGLFWERPAYYYSIIITSPGGNQKCAFRLRRPAKTLGSGLGSTRFRKCHKQVTKSVNFASRLRGVAFFSKNRAWIRPGSALVPPGSMRQNIVFFYILIINSMVPHFGRFWPTLVDRFRAFCGSLLVANLGLRASKLWPESQT